MSVIDNGRNWIVDWQVTRGWLIMEKFENGVLQESRTYLYPINSWALMSHIYCHSCLEWTTLNWPDAISSSWPWQRDLEIDASKCLPRFSAQQPPNLQPTSVTSPLSLLVDAHFSDPCLSACSWCRVNITSTFHRSHHAEQGGPDPRYVRTWRAEACMAKFFCRQCLSTCGG